MLVFGSLVIRPGESAGQLLWIYIVGRPAVYFFDPIAIGATESILLRVQEYVHSLFGKLVGYISWSSARLIPQFAEKMLKKSVWSITRVRIR